MKIYHTMFWTLVLLCINVHANTISKTDALQKAKSFLSAKDNKASVETYSILGKAEMYKVVTDEGWCLLSSKKSVKPVLAYSTIDNFPSDEEMPEGMKWLFSLYEGINGYEKGERATNFGRPFHHCSSAALRSVLLVVLGTTDGPVPCFHGLDTAGSVLLCEEGCLVGCDLHQVLAARANHAAHFREARASSELTCLRRGRALYLAADIDAVTGVARGGRYAVRAQEHFLTVVMTGFGRFGECSGYAVDTGTPLYFCHSLLAITRATSGTALVVALRNALALSSDYPQSSLVNLSGSSSKPDERG